MERILREVIVEMALTGFEWMLWDVEFNNGLHPVT